MDGTGIVISSDTLTGFASDINSSAGKLEQFQIDTPDSETNIAYNGNSLTAIIKAQGTVNIIKTSLAKEAANIALVGQEFDADDSAAASSYGG